MLKLIINCKNLKKYYLKNKKKSIVLDGINLKIYKGEVVVIIGKSGSGKSVLLWLLSGLDTPSHGEIILNDEILNKKNNIIFQNFNLISNWTVAENVEASILYNGFSKKTRKQKVFKILEELNLENKYNYFPHEISIGEQQRVSIARTIITNPQIIFADEPTGSVDPETGKEIIDLLFKLVKKLNTTLVITTHYHFPQELADNIYILEKTKLFKKNDYFHKQIKQSLVLK